MTEPKHKNPLAERDWLRREYGRMRVENESLKSRLAAAKKVADAAVAVEIAGNARIEVGLAVEPNYESALDTRDAVTLLFDAQLKAMTALNEAVTEYRALTEPQGKEKANENHT